MFDHYLEHQQSNRPRQKQLFASTVASAHLLAACSLATWVVEAHQISGVAPPTISPRAIFASFLNPPAPPPPPPPPDMHDTGIDDPDESDVAEPDLFSEPPREPKKPALKPGYKLLRPQLRGPVGTGISCAVGSGLTDGPGSSKAASRQAKRAFSVVQAQAIYAPKPEHDRLRATKTGRFSRKNGSTVVSFCVNTSGRVVKLRTKRGFPGDPEIDAIVRDAVQRWRYRAFRVAGRPIEVCTDYRFNVEFQ